MDAMVLIYNLNYIEKYRLNALRYNKIKHR